jgi:predicted metal-dependent hydrolase
MAQFNDHEFGTVTVRKSGLAKNIRISIAPNATIRVSMPAYAPIFAAKRTIASSRAAIRAMLLAQHTTSYVNGTQVGKSHHVVVQQASQLSVTRKKLRIVVNLPPSMNIVSSAVQQEIRGAVISALRVEAKSYLTRRLEYLAERHGLQFASIRFSHASSRWGSCSSQGVISLNIALMNLDFELIDYVLLHELTHTKYMNHSAEFWRFLGTLDPAAKQHRTVLKGHSPHI